MITIETLTSQVRATKGVKPSVVLLLTAIADRLAVITDGTLESALRAEVEKFATSIRVNANIWGAACGMNYVPETYPDPGPSTQEQDNADRASLDAQREHEDAERAHQDALNAQPKPTPTSSQPKAKR